MPRKSQKVHVKISFTVDMGEPIESIPDLKWLMSHLLSNNEVRTKLINAGVQKIDPGMTINVSLGSAAGNPKAGYARKHGVLVGKLKHKRLSRYERPPVV